MNPNKEWVETAMRLADEYASLHYNSADHIELQARAALEAHLNTPNTDQVNSAKHQSTAAACLPLTEHQLDEALMTIPDTGREWNCVEICRAVERAHGIEHSAEAEKQNLPESLGIGREL